VTTRAAFNLQPAEARVVRLREAADVLLQYGE
jgi:hypothetical protein